LFSYMPSPPETGRRWAWSSLDAADEF